MRRIPSFLVVAGASLILSVAAHAQGKDPAATIDSDQQAYFVNTDGTWTMTRELSIRINNARAIATLAQQPFQYNATLETLDIVEAYTEKPDGRKVPVLADGIREQQAQGSADGVMFEDTHIKVAIFPHVEVGDRLVMRVQQRQVKPIFSGQFQDMTLPPSFEVKHARVVYDLPEQMVLHADARGYTAAMLPAAPGRQRYRFDYVEHADRSTPKWDAVSQFDGGDRLVVSTMANNGALGLAYQLAAAGKAEVTPAIRALQRSVTQGVSGPGAQARVLGDWVRKNIRYVALYIGTGGIVPHAASEILEHRYGDCKDHVTLLEALLAAAGIDSTPALINSGNAFTLPSVGAVGVLNHVITFVPSLNLYIDSTASDEAAGYLPQGDLGKTVVLTKMGMLGQTPARQLNTVTNDSEIVIDAEGRYRATNTQTMRGAAAEENRYRNRNAQWARHEGSTVDLGQLEETADEYVTKETSRGAARFDDRKRLEVQTGLTSSYIQFLIFGRDAMLLVLPDAQNYPCVAGDVVERVSINVPDNYKLVRLPQPIALHSPHLDYTVDFKREKQFVVIQRRYHKHPEGVVCTPDDRRATLAMRPQILADLTNTLMFAPRQRDATQVQRNVPSKGNSRPKQ